MTCGGVSFYLQETKESEPVAEAPAPPPREQFVAEIEIPEEEPEVEPEEPAVDVVKQRKRAPVDCSGSLAPAQIRRAINGPPRKQVQTCYEHRLKDNNLLQGQMVVRLMITASGNVGTVSMSGSLRDSQVYSCVKRVARTWKFPRPQGGCVLTDVPFTMTPKL